MINSTIYCFSRGDGVTVAGRSRGFPTRPDIYILLRYLHHQTSKDTNESMSAQPR